VTAAWIAVALCLITAALELRTTVLSPLVGATLALIVVMMLGNALANIVIFRARVCLGAT
jgi:hypothetical protein